MSLSDRVSDEPGTIKTRSQNIGSAGDDAPRPKKVIIVGATENAKKIAEILAKSQRPKYEVVGFLAESGGDRAQDISVLGDAARMFDIAQEYGIDEIIIATVLDWQKCLLRTIAGNGNGHPKVHLVPSAYDAMMLYPKLARVDDLPLVTLNCGKSGLYRLIKRTFDIGFSLVALCVASPILACAALLTKITSRGPVFFRQARVGKDGGEFTLYKLRTMVQDAEKSTGPTLSPPNDERVTGVGRIFRRLKIDEIPQFYNVLKGDMSVVGPRPERRCFIDQYSRLIPGYDARHQVQPGITGMAQVYGGYATDPATKLKYDLIYVYGGSLWTDLKILALTLPTMVVGK